MSGVFDLGKSMAAGDAPVGRVVEWADGGEHGIDGVFVILYP